MERFVRALVIAAACVTTVWWLLRDSPEQERPAPSTPAQIQARVLEPRAVRALGNTPVADVRPASAPAVVAAAGGDTVLPIPLIEGVTLPGGMWTLHTMMEREPRDVLWAADMERRFSTYFASKQNLARNFGPPSVLCRTRFCEIQAVGYGPQAFDTWKAATEDLRDQAWAEELRGGGIYTTQSAPNEQVVMLILMRTWRVTRDRGPPPR